MTHCMIYYMVVGTVFRSSGRSTIAELPFLSLRNNGKENLSK